jgi:hypothetical protein
MKSALKHGHTWKGGCTPTYRSWVSMIQRVTNPNEKNYPRYGGRGIKVCESWRGRGGFARFLADIGERPEGKTLDRVDVNGDYEPGNCRWATRSEQQRNRRPMGTVQGRQESRRAA